MAPLHHHFELLGWGEVTIVTRFWIIAGLSRGWAWASSTKSGCPTAVMADADMIATPDAERTCACSVLGIGVAGTSAVAALRGARRHRRHRRRERRRGPPERRPRLDLADVRRRHGVGRLRAPLATRSARARRRGSPIWSEMEFAWRVRRERRAVGARDGHQRQDHHHADGGRHRGRRRASTCACAATWAFPSSTPRARSATSWPWRSRACNCTSRTRSRRTRPCASTPTTITSTGTAPSRRIAPTRRASIATCRSRACTRQRDRARSRRMVEEADVVEGCRAIGVTLGAPSVSQLGVVDGTLWTARSTTTRRTRGDRAGSRERPRAPRRGRRAAVPRHERAERRRARARRRRGARRRPRGLAGFRP